MTTGSSARSWRLGLEAIIILGPALACSSIALHGSPNQPDAAGFTPLMHAARAGDLDRVRGLLRRGADPNYQGRKVKRYGLLFPFVEESWEDEPFESQTPLMLASAAGHAPVVRVLTGAGADPNLGTRLGQPGRTPLWFAAGAGHREASLALLEAGASRTSWATYQAVGLARSNGHLELARTLVQQGAGVRVDDMGGQMEVTGWSSMLSEAARDGQHELVRDLLQAGVDVRGERGGTTLRAAAKEGRAEVVRLLLAAGAAPDGAGLPVGSTALGLAAGQGHAECVRVLARAGADPNAAQPFAGAPPLVLAAQRGHLEVLRVLLEHGADVESRDDRGQSALARAAARNDREMMDLLQSRGASPRDVLAPELLAAVKTGDVRRVAALLARGAPVDVREDHARRTPLMLAALDGRRDLLRLLLRSGADVNAQDASGQSALLLAVVNGSLQIVRDLIAAGARVGTDPRANPIPLAVARKRIDLVGALAAAADPEARAQGLRTASEKGVVEAQKLLTRGLDGAALSGALVEAARAGQAEAVRRLLAAGAPATTADDRGITALMWAAYAGDADTIRALAKSGADVNRRVTEYRVGDGRLPRSTGWTALGWAACREHPQAVAALLEHGADVRVQDSRGTTAMSCAAENGALEVVGLLRQAGASEPVDERAVRTRALLRAAHRGHVDRVKQLLGQGAPAGSADDYGLTPLHEAARAGRAEVVSVLLSAGADPNARHRDGHTPLWEATQRQHREVVELLKARGAVARAPGAQ